MQINKELKNYFRINISVAIVAFLGTLLYYFVNQLSGQSPVLERYGIILTLAGMWVALKFFHWKTNKLDKSDTAIYLKQYRLYYLLRLGVLDIILLFNLCSLLFTGAKNFIFLAGIIIFGYLLCAPSAIEVSQENKN